MHLVLMHLVNGRTIWFYLAVGVENITTDRRREAEQR